MVARGGERVQGREWGRGVGIRGGGTRGVRGRDVGEVAGGEGPRVYRRGEHG